MLTTYALSLVATDATETDRITAVDLWSDWLAENYPFDSRPAGTSVRVRERSDDPVFRITVNETKRDHTNVFTVTVAYLNNQLLLDARNVVFPTTSKIAPQPPFAIAPSVVRTVRTTLQHIAMEDANTRVSVEPLRIATEIQGQEVGALIHAPSRRLPVVVEVSDFDRGTTPLFEHGLGPLVGLVHLVLITNPAALVGFTELSGLALITPGSIHACWAGGTEPLRVDTHQLPVASQKPELQRFAKTIIETAALSLPMPHLPPPPRDDDFDDTRPFVRPTNNRPHSTSEDSWAEALEDSERRAEELESKVMELEASLSSADHIIERQRNELEQKGVQLDEVVLRNVALEIQAGNTPGVVSISSVEEALRIARSHCPFLTFHDRAMESGATLHGPDPVLVLQDLVRLNDVARRWMAGEISDTSIVLACRQMGLDYAAKVSDTARQKFEADYLIEWRGRPVMAEAHIRRGRKTHLVRIHVYFDKETHQVVVAYIGRHLRDKGSSN
jgi:hypothetical protein